MLKNKSQKDLQIVLVLVALTIISIHTPLLSQTPLRTILGLIMVLFLVGYSLISALFPGKKDLDGIERIALSFGLSIAVTPLIGLILNYTPYGIRETPILITLSLFTIACTIIAHSRRMKLDEKDRFSLSLTYKLNLPGKKIDKILTIVLILSILAAISAVIYVIVTPKEGEKFTEFYILGPGGMADDYPTNLGVGVNGTVTLGVVNHEYAPTNYTIEVILHNETLEEMPVQLSHNESHIRDYIFTPRMNGTQKLEFLLHKEGLREPYRRVHLWITVINQTAV